MAAAEARAAWQRTVNRCFVQEDAKRAPKLACTQSSTPWSKQADVGPASAVDGADSPGLGFMPFNQNPSYFSLPPEARWWLQLDPNYDHQKGLSYGQLKSLEADAETARVRNVNSAPKVDGFMPLDENVEPSDVVNRIVSEKHDEVKIEEPSAMNCKIEPDVLDVKDLTDYYELMEMELVGGSASKQSSDLSYGMDSTWIEGERIPWWRKTDKDDLASFVAQKSLHHIENCDLPPTQKMHVRRELCKQPTCFDDDEMFVLLQEIGQSDATSSLFSGASPKLGSRRGSDWALVDRGLSESVTSRNLSMNYDKLIDKPRHSSEDAAKAQLLEALCHSQTRAREAEKAAKIAYREKEHILKLFFKQASQLFAYKQWFRLLQLESFYLQVNNSNKPPDNAALFPDAFLPWSGWKPTRPHKIWKKTAKGKSRKQGLPRCEICKYVVAFALGLSLVGAGLLLGWTVGWLWPGS